MQISFIKRKKVKLKAAVINALKIYSLHINATSFDIKFTLLIFALEGFLLTQDD